MNPNLSQKAVELIEDLEKMLMKLNEEKVNELLSKWMEELKGINIDDNESVGNDSVGNDSVNEKVVGNDENGENDENVKKRKRNDDNDIVNEIVNKNNNEIVNNVLNNVNVNKDNKDDNGKDGNGKGGNGKDGNGKIGNGKGGNGKGGKDKGGKDKGDNGKGGNGKGGNGKKRKVDAPVLQDFIDEFKWDEFRQVIIGYCEGRNIKDISLDGIYNDLGMKEIYSGFIGIKCYLNDLKLGGPKSEKRKEFMEKLKEKKKENKKKACFQYPIIMMAAIRTNIVYKNWHATWLIKKKELTELGEGVVEEENSEEEEEEEEREEKEGEEREEREEEVEEEREFN
ncbi:hypothetical protein ABK040_013119 [Willaertia magna]